MKNYPNRDPDLENYPYRSPENSDEGFEGFSMRIFEWEDAGIRFRVWGLGFRVCRNSCFFQPRVFVHETHGRIYVQMPLAASRPLIDLTQDVWLADR